MSSSTPARVQRQTSRSPSPLLVPSDKGDRAFPDSRLIGQEYLDIPLRTTPHHHHRPSLDSTYSDLSELSANPAELRHDRLPLLPQPAENVQHATSLSWDLPRRRRGIRGYLDAFWLRNKGVVLVLLAMVFGSGMNVAARLMETDGSHGTAMHPFQVGAKIRGHPILIQTKLVARLFLKLSESCCVDSPRTHVYNRIPLPPLRFLHPHPSLPLRPLGSAPPPHHPRRRRLLRRLRSVLVASISAAG
jgi:hypothetical protein